VVDYTVTAPAQILNKVGGFYTPDNGMVFVVVPISVTVHDDDLFTDVDDDLCLLTKNGSQYFTDISAEMFYTLPDGTDNPLWFPNLVPGQPTQGALIYQVPSSQTSGSVLAIGLGANHIYAIDLQL